MSKESNAYILGTDRAELYRLGLQHQVWSTEARRSWEIADFGPGQTILDLGCGPGFCSTELAYMVGEEGKIIAVDKSPGYIAHLKSLTELQGLNIECHSLDFHELTLEPNSIDGVYCRWALAWVDDVDTIIESLCKALRPGGAMVFQEYYDWKTLQTNPENADFLKAKAAVLQSFEDSPGDINIGRDLPLILEENGLEIVSQRPLSKLALPGTLTWEWPRSFLEIYLPRLVKPGYLTQEEAQAANDFVNELEYIEGGTLLCPVMTEVVAVRVD